MSEIVQLQEYRKQEQYVLPEVEKQAVLAVTAEPESYWLRISMTQHLS